MSTVNHSQVEVNSFCDCPACSESRAASALAIHLGMPSNIADPDGIVWDQDHRPWRPEILDEECPRMEDLSGPSMDDDASHLETVPGWFMADAPNEYDLSPWEQNLESCETAWRRAIREMEEQERDREYDRLLEEWRGYHDN